MTTSNKTFSVRLPDKTRIGLTYLSKITHRSSASIAWQILEDEVERKAKKLQAFQEGKKDIESGIFHSGEQIIRWLDSWGTKKELQSPEPDLFMK